MSRQSIAAQKAAGQRGQFGELPLASNGGIVLGNPDDDLRARLLAVHPVEHWDRIGSFDDGHLSEDILLVGRALEGSTHDAYVVSEHAGGDSPESIDVMVPVEGGNRTFFLTDTLDLDSFEPDHDSPGIGNAAHYLRVLTDSYDQLRAARDEMQRPREAPFAIVQGGMVQDSAVEVETVDLDWMDGDEDDVPDSCELERQARVLRQAMAGGGMWQGELDRIEKALAALEAEEG